MGDDPEHKPEPVHVVSAAIVRDETCLVAERGAGMSFSERWELPGGKVEPGELPRDALRRELREELALVDAEVGARIAEGRTSTEGREFRVEVFEVILSGDEPSPVEHSRHGWFRADELDSLDWVEPHQRLLPTVKAHLRRRNAAWPLDPGVYARRMTAMATAASEWATVPLFFGAAVSMSTAALLLASWRTALPWAR